MIYMVFETGAEVPAGAPTKPPGLVGNEPGATDLSWAPLPQYQDTQRLTSQPLRRSFYRTKVRRQCGEETTGKPGHDAADLAGNYQPNTRRAGISKWEVGRNQQSWDVATFLT